MRIFKEMKAVSAEQAILVEQDRLQDPLLEAEQLSDWLSEYLLTPSEEVGSLATPDTLPLLTTRRLQALAGEVSVDEQFALARSAFKALEQDSQYNAFLYLAGYPLDAIKKLGDIVDDDEQYPIQQLFAAAKYLSRLKRIHRANEARFARMNRSSNQAGVIAIAQTVGYETVDPSEMGWKKNALCTQSDPELFFPGHSGVPEEVAKICSGCSVAEKCLAYALENREAYGIWGGYSTEDRKKHKIQIG